MTTLFISAFLLGLIFNAAPGAVFAETVRQGVRGGYRPALGVQLGSLVGDALWAVLGLVGIGLLLQLDWLRWPIGVAGTLYLLWLARDAWRAASVEFLVAGDAGVTQRSATRAGVLLSVTNPQNIAYWAALGSAMGAVGVHEPSATDYGIFFAGFMVSSVVWAFVCAAIVDRLFARSGQQWAKLTYRLCAVAFVALALGTLRDLIAPAELQPAKAKAGVSAPK
ncbi:MAG TPA: LysE family transporter [Casimicrobium huifangae]|jgi:chemosensory pili system protein ChpE/L-lysine exporter family protein LysE/ArgO|uniref:LysE family transporter n=1 Tax=Casimicrobium huifangae TaxID=2591109 RepID=UPI0012EBA116|nr:LysE family transporter [Casimicrobium huifangae]HOB00896.1 LysE family transporter [Casimicrobium huifangae]HQD66554.1 LysE family transporter [Casimicrobium huifangae]